jgi:hypothetical protein
LISISTESMAKAVRRSSGFSKRYRHSVRVNTDIGGTNAPASAASGAIAASARCNGCASNSNPSSNGCTAPVTSSVPRGPYRSINRPWTGALAAIATR